ncbi:tRNA (adenosine(37)-N6)-threonylcarbamoyltransferase complex dimerization subunit type 1 TsaB [Acidiferrimicrobium sp. IK]|uniref:tRNA (adenosine(37)-N6)-threonylcarbamoyltransferase complex dimerization subunit type 1 TsaB n=1 Tax=Acidiferrimicrobium sp. IK TaxID=2871700 RepID=UPI0021CB5B21|nr:tRNA (adenosine(37)-N6)-threonylcarbamoyltransferase complex dimerization subunit type 1 TsaB [Acidiferrimicrobium sp. IK]MCU4184991.1 tRNA (adenosine(37)-N6)-threonylcarbamoyltransferase complex dimerization subunit type 1 TsaB [Acidiferrimicrobium sp. IK]
MIVLALDTATPQVGVALCGPDGPLASLHVRDARRHGELLAPAVETVCRMAGVALREVGMVAADVGPGLFTGLRVGLSTAKALASALGLPAAGFTSTEILAAAHAGVDRPVAAVVDIRRREVAWGLYEPSGAAMREVHGPQRAEPAELAALLAGMDSGVLAVGDGALRYAADMGKVALGGPLAAHPSAEVLGQLALQHPERAGAAQTLAPCYLRDADVRIGWQQAPDHG